MVINSSILFIGILVFVAGGSLALKKYTSWKIFDYVPPLVWVYLILMILCTIGLFNSEVCSNTYSSLKNNLLYGMIFVMLLRCDFRKLIKLGGRMLGVFLACSLTLAIGFIIGYLLFKNSLGNNIWGAVAALFASWIGGSANMAAMSTALPVEPGAYGCAIALDTVCYSLWIALLLYVVRFEKKWNRICNANTDKLKSIGSNNSLLETGTKSDSSTDFIFLLGIALLVSAISQICGESIYTMLSSINITMFDKGTCSTLFVTIFGLICAMTPLGKLSAIEKLSDTFLYVVISLLASQASLTDLLNAPMWVVYGLFILVIHAILMFILSKIFHLDLCLVSIASLSNIGGAAASPIVASAYNPAFAGIGVLMGVFGAAIGNFLGIAMGFLLKLI